MDIKSQMRKLLLDAQAIADAAEQAKRDLSAEERTKITQMLEDYKALKLKFKEQEGDEATRKAIKDLLGEFGGLPDGGAPAGGQALSGQAASKGTVGERFVNAANFKNWMSVVAPGGQVPEGVKGLHSPPIEFKSMGLFGRKDLITGVDPTSAGAFVQTDYSGIYEPLGRFPLTMLDIIARRTTTNDLVEFVRQTVQVMEAAPTPEANVKEYSGATGEIEGKKPQGKMYFEKVHAPVKTIAVWVAATKRALSDAAQIRGIIDQELREDLAEELENQILNGNGVGENLTGIANTAGILVQPFGVNILTTCRRAITTLLVTGHQRPNYWVVNPVDWETVDLLQDLTGAFYWGGPLNGGPPRLWGVPVVQSFLKTQGTAYLGNWNKVVFWDREAYSLQVTDSHEDFFVRNIVAFLGEIRGALGVIRPSGICEVTLA